MLHTVWRVEMPCGAGPYVGGECKNPEKCNGYRNNYGAHSYVYGMADAHCDKDHPSPFADGMEYEFSYAHFCGVEDFLSLQLWFDGWMERLHELGYVAQEYLIDSDVEKDAYVHGNSVQVIFKRTHAKVISTRALIEC